MKKPYFVPETQKISDLMRQLQRRKEQMAIVVDEHGAMTGIVTLEDVLEEIVGEIVDETEVVESNIVTTGPSSWTVLGRTDIDEVNKKLKMKLKGGEYETFSGFVMKLAGKIPQEGDTYLHNSFTLRVITMDKHRIEKVHVEKKTK